MIVKLVRFRVALKNKFYYICALCSKNTHENICQRLKEAGFSDEQINSIHGPIGIKLGGRSAPEIALSITAQLVSETYNKKWLKQFFFLQANRKDLNPKINLLRDIKIPL